MNKTKIDSANGDSYFRGKYVDFSCFYDYIQLIPQIDFYIFKPDNTYSITFGWLKWSITFHNKKYWDNYQKSTKWA